MKPFLSTLRKLEVRRANTFCTDTGEVQADDTNPALGVNLLGGSLRTAAPAPLPRGGGEEAGEDADSIVTVHAPIHQIAVRAHYLGGGKPPFQLF